MEEVYIITSGSYSDYSVHGSVPDKETGERILAELRASGDHYGKDFDLETIPVITGVVVRTILHMNWAPSVRDGSRETVSEWTGKSIDFNGESVFQPAVYSEGWHGDGFSVSGYDHDRVRHIFGDKRAEHIARLQGL